MSAHSSRVLVLSPHPDDEAVGCGGTLRLHADAGEDVRVVFLTSGEAGGHGSDPSNTAARREREAQTATALLGVTDLSFWRSPDGHLRASAAAVARARQEIESWGATRVYAPHDGEMHRDHRAAARIARAAVRGTAAELLLFEIWTPLSSMDEIVDITSTIDAKLEAIRAYESQCSVMRFDEAFAGLARYRGEMFSWPEGDYAEIFVRGDR